jgi:hypothetical protein
VGVRALLAGPAAAAAALPALAAALGLGQQAVGLGAWELLAVAQAVEGGVQQFGEGELGVACGALGPARPG